jgi:crotonobetainyl-CoA:carnitine CoA-transferase CaiB-like acyl-CoA transferase
VAHTSLLQGYLVSMGILWSRAEVPDEAFARSLTKNNVSSGGAGVPRYRCADDKWMYCMGPAEILPAMQEILRELGVPLPPDTEKRRPSDTGWAGVGEQSRIEAFAKRSRAEWLEDMWNVGIPAAPCLKIGEVLFDEQAALNEYVLEVEDPRYGKTRQAGKPFVTTPPQKIYSHAPHAGQHTLEVLAEDWSPRFAARGHASGRPPLAGCKILDFGQFLSSPTAPMLMAHLGADVIKIEPTVGDGMRATPLRPFSPGRSFGHVNRGKRSLAADLKDRATRTLVEDMVRWADVFHHNVRYEATQRLGLDADALRTLNPRLVYCHTSAYGHTGARAGWPGFDPLMQGFAGWSVEGAGEGNPPMWHRTGFIDFQCGLASLVATLLALYHRMKTGDGQFVSASLLGGAIQSVSDVFALPDGSLSPAPRLDANQTGISPFDRIYQCNDRYWIAVLAETPAERRALLDAFGAKSAEDLEQQIGRYSQDHAIYKASQAGVAMEAVRLNGKELFYESRANQDAGLTVKHRHALFGDLEQPGLYWYMAETALVTGPPPPAIGEHTREICRQFGMSDDTYAGLEAAAQLFGMSDRDGRRQ